MFRDKTVRAWPVQFTKTKAERGYNCFLYTHQDRVNWDGAVGIATNGYKLTMNKIRVEIS